MSEEENKGIFQSVSDWWDKQPKILIATLIPLTIALIISVTLQATGLYNLVINPIMSIILLIGKIPFPPTLIIANILRFLLPSLPWIVTGGSLVGIVLLFVGLAFYNVISAWACDPENKYKNFPGFTTIKGMFGCPDAGGIGGGGFGFGKDTCTVNPDGTSTGAFSINGLEGCWDCPPGYSQNRKRTSIQCKEGERGSQDEDGSGNPTCKSYTKACKKGIFTTAAKVEDFKLLDINNLICDKTLDPAIAAAAGLDTKSFKGLGGGECVACRAGYHPRLLISAGNSTKCESDAEVSATNLGKAVSCNKKFGSDSFRGVVNCYKCPPEKPYRKSLTGTSCVAREPALPVPSDLSSGGCAETNDGIESNRLYKFGVKQCYACPEGFVPTPSGPRGGLLLVPGIGIYLKQASIAIKRGPVACVKQEDKGSISLAPCLKKENRAPGQSLIDCIKESKTSPPIIHQFTPVEKEEL